MEKLIVYIDGFNLYYGLRDHSRRKHLWLDVVALSRSLRPRSDLALVKYFTAPVLDDPAAAKRQARYHKAMLAQNPQILQIIQGRFQRRTVTCRECETSWITYEEKETDVNVATAVVADAALGKAEAAMIVSGDSDLAPAVRTARNVSPKIFIAAAFPPSRYSAELKSLMPASFHIAPAKIRKAQLPDVVADESGRTYARPRKWR